MPRTCGTMDEHRRLLIQDPFYAAARNRIENAALSFALGERESSRTGITRIPVVVHVVWNTTAQNVSDDQVNSQIDVLNEDYRMRNADLTQVPTVWQGLTADCRIEFELATVDPNGQPTTGITRTQTTRTSFAQ